jgi:subtilisin family serine protease
MLAKVLTKSIVFLFLLTLVVVQSATAENTPHAGDLKSASSARLLTPPQFDALIAKAQTTGAARVIVGLRVNYQPEGRLRSVQAIQAQRRAIEQAQNTLLNQLAKQNVKVIRKFQAIPYLVMDADAGALATLATWNIASIMEDRRRHPSLTESGSLIGTPNAWTNGYTGAGQVVAIIDTGVDKTHPFLAGKVVSEACYSTTYPPDTATSLCPGGVSQSTDPGSGMHCTVVGICVHGTHVAGIAAGKDDGAIGFSGVAKDADLIAIQVFSYFSDCACIQAYDSDILAGLERVQTLGGSYNIAAVNLSLGGETYTSQAACDTAYPVYRDMFASLQSIGIAPVCASGNDYSADSIEMPACVSTAVSVGSTQDGSLGSTVDAVSSFSDSASFLTFLAPGQYIYSSMPNGNWGNMMGTSMATPHVAGAWAILKSASPSATVAQVRLALHTTGKFVTDPRNNISKPRIQIDTAAQFLLDPKIYFFPFVSK